MAVEGVNAQAIKSSDDLGISRKSGAVKDYNKCKGNFPITDRVHRYIDDRDDNFATDAGSSLLLCLLAEARYTWGGTGLATRERGAPVEAQPKPAQPRARLVTSGKTHESSDAIIEKWKNVLRINPNDTEALFGLAEAYEKVGECIKAVECYQRYIDLVPYDRSGVGIARENVEHLCKVIRAVYSCCIGGCA